MWGFIPDERLKDAEEQGKAGRIIQVSWWLVYFCLLEQKLHVRCELWCELVFADEDETEGDGMDVEHLCELLLCPSSGRECVSNLFNIHPISIQ